MGGLVERCGKATVRGWRCRDEAWRLREHPSVQEAPGRMDDAGRADDLAGGAVWGSAHRKQFKRLMPTPTKRKLSWGHAFLGRLVGNFLETNFERAEGCSGLLESPCILEQSYQPQPHDDGFQAVADLVGRLVVSCEHGSVSFRNASAVPSTLLDIGCLIHEISRRKATVPEK